MNGLPQEAPIPIDVLFPMRLWNTEWIVGWPLSLPIIFFDFPVSSRALLESVGGRPKN